MRNLATGIYFMVPDKITTAWHRVSSDEMWHFYQGDALELEIKDHNGKIHLILLGDDIQAGEHHQYVVPGGLWQRARSRGMFTLVGCTVTPGFEFADFEIEKGS